MTIEKRTLNSPNRLLCCSLKGERLTTHRARNLFIGLCASLPITLALPVEALQVQVTPAKPRLGDTLSVLINLDNPDNGITPELSVGDKNYPTYEISPNKYRAFIPTTPLEKPGTRVIKVTGEGQVKKLAVTLSNRKFPVQRITLPPGKSGSSATEYELNRVADRTYATGTGDR